MGIIKRSFTIGAGTLNRNVLAGEIGEILERASAVRIYANQQVVVGSNIEIDINVGSNIGGQAIRPNIATLAGQVDKQLDGFPALTGMPLQRIQIAARETTGIAGNNGILNILVETMALA